MEMLYCPFGQWRQLCASRPIAVLELLVISRQLLQLEIASRSFEKQVFNTVGNTQAHTRRTVCWILSSQMTRYITCVGNTTFHFVCVLQHWGTDKILHAWLFCCGVFLTGLCKDFALLPCPHVAAALMQVKSIRWVWLWFPGTGSAELGF